MFGGFYDAWATEVCNTFAFSYYELFIGEMQVGDIVRFLIMCCSLEYSSEKHRSIIIGTLYTKLVKQDVRLTASGIFLLPHMSQNSKD